VVSRARLAEDSSPYLSRNLAIPPRPPLHHPLHDLALADVEEAPGEHEQQQGGGGTDPVAGGIVQSPEENEVAQGADEIRQRVPAHERMDQRVLDLVHGVHHRGHKQDQSERHLDHPGHIHGNDFDHAGDQPERRRQEEQRQGGDRHEDDRPGRHDAIDRQHHQIEHKTDTEVGDLLGRLLEQQRLMRIGDLHDEIGPAGKRIAGGIVQPDEKPPHGGAHQHVDGIRNSHLSGFENARFVKEDPGENAEQGHEEKPGHAKEGLLVLGEEVALEKLPDQLARAPDILRHHPPGGKEPEFMPQVGAVDSEGKG